MNKFKKVVALVTASVLTCGSMNMAYCANEQNVISTASQVAVFVNNDPIEFGNAIVEVDTTYVPVNPVFEKMGYKVKYDSREMVVEMTKGSDELTINLSENTMSGVITDSEGNAKDVSTFISNSKIDQETGMTLIPVRSISENLDCDVYWSDNAVWVYSPDFTGEKVRSEDEVEDVVITEDDLYITTISSIISKQQDEYNVDYLVLTDDVDTGVREFHSVLSQFLNMCKQENNGKRFSGYSDIDTDFSREDWEKLDDLSAYLLLLHKNLDMLEEKGIIDNVSYLKQTLNDIYYRS